MDTSKLVVLIWALPVLTVLAILAIIKRFVSIKKHLPSPKDTTSNLHLADPTSSSPPTWDVFLSFYGKDTRRNFISHLYTALEQAGILAFRDDPALEKGQEISSGLLDAIKHSKIFIIVVSENYARSPWCLNELLQILSCNRTEIQIVPVFYYVDPSDVRRHKRSFREALDGHKKHYSVDMIEKWKSALSEIAELSGHHLRKEAYENESDTIQEIVRNVATWAATTVSHLEKHLFGLDSAIEEIDQKLNMESNDIRVIGICGMGGIGKTTIAQAFYNKNFNKFDISCFNKNVKQHSQGGSHLLPSLKQLLIDLLEKNDHIRKATDVESRIRLKQILHSKKALVVLDDLAQSNYSELLANLGNLLSPGSRIIITTRDSNLLEKLKVDILEVDIYMVKTLGKIESLELFSYHAFRKSTPPEKYRELSLSFVIHAGGLPLALKVLGSSLLGKTDESFWKGKLEQVQLIPENDIQKILQLSYDELEDETYRAIFLDIAFFFVGKDKDEAAMVFKSCDFIPDVGIPILVDRCLLTIDTNNKFQMHNLIQDMGMRLGRSTRLFLQENAWKDLQNQEGRNNIEGLVLDLRAPRDGQIIASWFEELPNLRLLQIIGARDVKGNFKNLFPQLRCIRWHSCPWTHIPSTFRPRNLVSIDMPSSKFKILWRGPPPIKQLNNLYGLYLSGCHYLKQLPEQLGEMKGLKMIDVSFTAIDKLSDSITQLTELAELNLRDCKKLKKIPEQIGNMKSLRRFDASYTAIEQLPDSFVRLTKLEILYLSGCSIKKLPDSITQLKELFSLDLRYCEKLRKIPEQIGNMEGLRTFNAFGTAIEQLPDSFGGLINLVELDLGWCQNLRNLPDNIWKLKLLKTLELNGCSKLERLPKQLGEMQCLESLWASYTAIREVPDSIGLLSRLQFLNLRNNEKLKYVPESIWNLTSIQNLRLDDSGDIGIISLPDSVEKLNKLTTLHLSCNVRLCLPMILCFSSLKDLTLTDEGESFSSAEPVSLSQLFNLRELSLNKCTSLGSLLPELPLNLKVLRIRDHSSLEQLPDLSSLKLLEELSIFRCDSLRSISILPSHLRLLSIYECTSLQDLPDLSVLKELASLKVIECNNLKSISLKQSFLQVPFKADLLNREVAEWFSYKSSGRTITFDIPPSIGSKFLGLALWVVYTCKPMGACIKAVITNNTESITENYPIHVFTVGGETQSSIRCITREKMRMKSGDKIKVSIRSSIYSLFRSEVPVGKVKVMMCGVHVIQDRLLL